MTQSPLAALLLSAFERYRAGKPAEAERALREVLAQDPEQPLALDLLALLELARGDVTDAMTLLQRALDAEPTAARWALYGHVRRSSLARGGPISSCTAASTSASTRCRTMATRRASTRSGWECPSSRAWATRSSGAPG
jgi:tetratricopeptide (TPR) repeat protein